MKFLNRKLYRDILKNWTQFLSVFFMAFLSVFIYVGLEGVWFGMRTSVNNFIEDTNLAHSWIYTTFLTDEDIAEISNITGVDGISAITRIQVSIKTSDSNSYLILDTVGNDKISQPVVITGLEIDSEAIGIWLNLEYAKAHDVQIGESLIINFQGLELEVEILGIIQSSSRMYFTGTSDFMAPDAEFFGHGIVSYPTLIELSHHGFANMIEIEGADNEARELIPYILNERFISYFNRDTLFDVSNAIGRSEEIQSLTFLFSFVAILLSILAMYTTIKRLIESQIQDIATLMALGYSNTKIGLHYSSFGLLVGGIGAVVGALVAPLLSLFVTSTQQLMFSVPNWQIAYTPFSIFVIILITFICTISAFLASRKARVGLPAHFLRGGSVKMGKSVFLEKISNLWSNLNFGSRWTLRDALSSPIRVLMGVVGVSGGMMLLLAGLGNLDSLNHQVDYAFGVDFTHSAQITVNTLNTDDQNAALHQELAGQWLQRLSIRTNPDDGFDRILTIFADGDYMNLLTVEENSLEGYGIYLTEGFANAVNLEVGDKLSLRASLDANEYEFEIVGIIASSSPQGVYIHANLWEEVGGNFNPQIMLVEFDSSVDELRLDERIIQVITTDDQRNSGLLIAENVGGIVRIIIFFATLIVVVILYNLGALSFSERTRDYATLRVLGFHRAEIRKLTMRENIVTTIIGWIIGIPAGFWFLTQFMQIFSNHQIVYYPHIEIGSIIIASIIVIGASLSTTFFLGNRIKKIDMVEAIKGVE